VLIFSLLASSNAISHSFSGPISAASKSQIRFAIENKYDDTGPGAKGPEYAYNTYKTLEEALISYLDDPDTKLPEGERERAVAALQIPPIHTPIRQYPKTVEEYTGYKPTERPALKQYDLPKEYYRPVVGVNEHQVNNIGNNYVKANDGVRFHRVHPVQNRPVGSVYYNKQPQTQQTFSSFNPNPRYSFSYGVHDKSTGDSKSAHESRTDGVVTGYYTFMDADGKQRTQVMWRLLGQGFRATVQRSTSAIQ
ncbi:Cuticle protein, partial [Danaus plexippus plexippus]